MSSSDSSGSLSATLAFVVVASLSVSVRLSIHIRTYSLQYILFIKWSLAVHRYAKNLNISTSVFGVMGDCKPPLADIRNCNHRRREPSLDENGNPRCQCGLDEKAILMIEEGNWDGKTGSEPSEGWWFVHGQGGLGHTRKWERKSSNGRHTLRIDEGVLKALNGGKNDLGIETRGRPKGKGRTGGKDGKHPGKGRPASGNPHLMRGQTLRVLIQDIGMIAKLLEKATAEDWRPGKKKDVSLCMPNMELAMEEMLDELDGFVCCRSCNERVQMKGCVKCSNCGEEDKKKFKKRFEGHYLLSKNHVQAGWAPTLCRLIEIRAMYGVEVRAEALAQERLIELNNPEYETKEEELYEGLGVGVFPSRKTSKN